MMELCPMALKMEMKMEKRKAMERPMKQQIMMQQLRQQRKRKVQIYSFVSDLHPSFDSAESKGTNDAKSSSHENEAEAGEVPDAPRALHRTLSIFFRQLAMQTTKDDLENVFVLFEYSHCRLIRSFVRSFRLALQTIRWFPSCLHHGSSARTKIHSSRLGDIRSHRSNSKYLL